MEAILVKELSKHFFKSKKKKIGKRSSGSNTIIRAVDAISFTVNRGEIFGFLGPNGAGKTTTIRMMTGVLKPSKGNIKIFDHDVWKNPIPIKQITGNVPEEANAYLELTGWQNLIFIGEIYGISKKDREERAESLLKKFELFEKGKMKTKKYSKGMKQRLLLCMALITNPEVLFLDEPTSGLDVQSARIIKQLIKDYNEKGMTIFLTTHDMEVANELCHRIAIINRGKLISLDTPENLKKLTQEYLAIDCYFNEAININEFKKLHTIKEVQGVKDGCHIIVEDVNEALFEIMNYVKSNNLTIKQINTHQPRLEDVFLKIIERGDSNE